MNELITNPRLLFPMYLVLTNTFLITTHYPTEPIEKYENAEMWMTLVSVVMMHQMIQKSQQQFQRNFQQQLRIFQEILEHEQNLNERYNYTRYPLGPLGPLNPSGPTTTNDNNDNNDPDVDSDDSEEVVG
jgi:hypothetical protein